MIIPGKGKQTVSVLDSIGKTRLIPLGKILDALRDRGFVVSGEIRPRFLYRPLPEWVNPVVEWASAR